MVQTVDTTWDRDPGPQDIWSFKWDETKKCDGRRTPGTGWTDRREGGNSGLDK